MRVGAKGPLGEIGEEFVRFRKRTLSLIVPQMDERVLEHVGGERGTDHGDGADGAVPDGFAVEVRSRDGGGARSEEREGATEDVVFEGRVRDGVGRHVKEEKVALLGAEDALVDEAFR